MEKSPIEVLDIIIEDCEADVKEYDGREFNGRTLGEIHGILQAKIEALARVMKTIIEESEKK